LAVFYFGQSIENFRSSPKSRASLFHDSRYILILTKNGLSLILGDFFTNSSGHPGLSEAEEKQDRLVQSIEQTDVKK
jgi:hypothetical protein